MQVENGGIYFETLWNNPKISANVTAPGRLDAHDTTARLSISFSTTTTTTTRNSFGDSAGHQALWRCQSCPVSPVSGSQTPIDEEGNNLKSLVRINSLLSASEICDKHKFEVILPVFCLESRVIYLQKCRNHLRWTTMVFAVNRGRV